MFKQKNKKIIQSDNRITLDAKHNEIIKNFKDEYKNIKKYQQELDILKEKLNKILDNPPDIINPDDLTIQFDLENRIKELQLKIDNLENQKDETDYIIETGNILYEYYNNIDDVASQTVEKEVKKEVKKVEEDTPKIMNFFGGPVVKKEDEFNEG